MGRKTTASVTDASDVTSLAPTATLCVGGPVTMQQIANNTPHGQQDTHRPHWRVIRSSFTRLTMLPFNG